LIILDEVGQNEPPRRRKGASYERR